MFPYILIFWYPCRDWLAGNSQAFPGPDATIRAIPDKNYSSIYLHTLASICKKVLTLLSQAVATWPLGKTTTIWRWKPCQTRWPNIYISMTKKIFSIILSEVLTTSLSTCMYFCTVHTILQWYFSLYLSQPNSAHSPYLYLYMYLYLYSG